MSYFAIKHTHVALAVLSVALFVLRAGFSIWHGKTLTRPAKVAMHLIDTVLFGLGCLLLYVLAINPFVTPWLITKLITIVIYILIGLLLIRSKSKPVKVMSFLLCCVLAIFIFSVALSKNPQGFLY
ncbi:MAG: SirB2 family protein [Polynucleobacter victoriensis]